MPSCYVEYKAVSRFRPGDGRMGRFVDRGVSDRDRLQQVRLDKEQVLGVFREQGRARALLDGSAVTPPVEEVEALTPFRPRPFPDGLRASMTQLVLSLVLAAIIILQSFIWFPGCGQ
jgi:hypothetical protein